MDRCVCVFVSVFWNSSSMLITGVCLVSVSASASVSVSVSVSVCDYIHCVCVCMCVCVCARACVSTVAVMYV